jgi:N utilization substance protein A
MNRELIIVTEQIAREKGIDKEVLFEALESALLSAFKKTTGVGAADNVRLHLDRETGTLKVWARKRVVTKVADPKVELTLAEARAITGDAQLDDEVEQELVPQELGRIAAQAAKQVILQRVRDAEREGIYSEFIHKEGQIVRGVVHRIERRNVIVELGKAEGFLPEREQIPTERINPGDRIRAYVLEVKKTAKGPQITLSRTHPGFLARLFETEIPEIAEGIVQVKAAAREAGERAKVAVASTKRDVDPIGACVGLRGTRIQVVSRELRGEKIDIVEWSADPAMFVARALSPAKVASVTVQEGRPGEGSRPEAGAGPVERSVLVVVPDNQLSLAIGKRGQNARLAAKLTGMRVDIKSEAELEEERRREEEERTQGRAAIEEFAGVGPQLVEKLVEEGLYSPLRIVRAGLARLLEIPGVGEKKAEKILAAAQEWVAAHPPGAAAGEGAPGESAPVGEEAGVLPAGPEPEVAGPQPPAAGPQPRAGEWAAPPA